MGDLFLLTNSNGLGLYRLYLSPFSKGDNYYPEYGYIDREWKYLLGAF